MHSRLMKQKEKWQERQLEGEQRRQREWARKIALRQEYEEHQRKREDWHLQQPDRLCRACQQVLPATAFEVKASPDGFLFYTRCKPCHQALREQQYPACCLCRQKKSRSDFLSYLNDYALCGNGTFISLCCKACEGAFNSLPYELQSKHVERCCQRTFPAGQVIYGEVDPETNEIRYIGRTAKPKRRHAQHLSDASTAVAHWGTEQKVWYTRGNWIRDLAERGFAPSMRILHTVKTPPLVVEWELRWIWHGIQQGWRLLNAEAMDKELRLRIQAASLNFLTASFDALLQQHFFASHELIAFLHQWYHE